MRDFKPHYKRPERKKLDNPPTGLVLTREVGQAIIIGDDILVTVTEISGKRVRICVTAPPHVAVDRTEVRAAKALGPKECPSNHRQ